MRNVLVDAVISVVFAIRRGPWWDCQMGRFKMVGRHSGSAKMLNAVCYRLTVLVKQVETWAVNSDIKSYVGDSWKGPDKKRPMTILMDNCAQAHFTHLFKTVTYKQRATWPNGVPNEVEVLGQEPIYEKPKNDKDGKLVENMKYVPSLLYLSKQGHIKLFSSDALFAERMSQPVGMYSKMDWISYDLFSDVEFTCLDGYEAYCSIDEALEWKDGKICFREDWFREHPTLAHLPKSNEYGGLVIQSTDKDPFGTAPNSGEKLRDWLAGKRKEVTAFDELVKCLGKSNIGDAWHIYIAEKYEMDFFLTMDFNLARSVSSQRGNGRIQSLNVKVVTPKELGVKIGIKPLRQKSFQMLNKNTILHDGRRQER